MPTFVPTCNASRLDVNLQKVFKPLPLQSHAQVPCLQTQTQPSPDEYRVRQYSQGPQGDPFAPQIVGPFFPVEHEPPVPPQKPKRKRRVRREEECSFCQGNDKRNKNGDPEPMATCDECGRSGLCKDVRPVKLTRLIHQT